MREFISIDFWLYILCMGIGKIVSVFNIIVFSIILFSIIVRSQIKRNEKNLLHYKLSNHCQPLTI